MASHQVALPWARVLLLALIVLTLSGPSAPPAGKTYYIRNGGSDAADGLSDQTAWATLEKANLLSFGAGDSILLECGSTWNEDLKITSSGSAGAPLTISSYGTGSPPKLDLLVLWEVSHVAVSGLYMRADNDLLGACIYHSSDVLFEHNIVDGLGLMNTNRYTIAEVGYSHDIRIIGNRFKNGGNHNGNDFGGGLNLKDGCHDILVEGNISYNQAEYCFQCGSLSSIPDYNITFRGNTAYNDESWPIDDCRGINVGCNSHDVIVEKNVVYNTKTFLIATDADTRNVIIRNNILSYTLDSGESTFILVLAADFGNSFGTRIYNNTMFHTSTVSRGRFILFNTYSARISRDHEICNNIFVTYNPEVSFIQDNVWPGPYPTEFDSDYNLFYSMIPCGRFVSGGAAFSSLGEWTFTSGKDSHSLYANPLMTGMQDFDQNSVTGPEIASNTSFSANTEGWSFWAPGYATFSRTTTPGEYYSSPGGGRVDCQSSGDIHSNIQLALDNGTGFGVQAGQWYVFSFMAKASTPFLIHSASLVKKGTSTQYASWKAGDTAAVSASWKPVRMFFRADTTASDAAAVIYLGSTMPPGTSFFLDNASFALAEDLNARIPVVTDYHTPPASPAVNQGRTLIDVPDDFQGQPRPKGPAYDIGAYEN